MAPFAGAVNGRAPHQDRDQSSAAASSTAAYNN
jgi:hypothetical protein